MNFNFLRYKKIYFAFSGAVVLACLASLFAFGLNLGIDFTGGSILEVAYEDTRPSSQAVREALAGWGDVYVQPTDENGLIIRMKHIDEKAHQEVLQILGEGYLMEERRFESIGPIIGRELKDKTTILVVLALVSIVLYIAFAFRKVQRPIKSWQYGLVSLLVLFHDILVPVGVFAVLGNYFGAQFTIPIITALLLVLGYSINNTVVVFDRIRENLIKKTGVTFEETVNKSLNQVFARCINTSLTTLLVLLAIFFFGGETLRYFSLAMMIGVAAGTYSSLFLVGPILSGWLTRRPKRD